jgi:hypothetical protein
LKIPFLFCQPAYLHNGMSRILSSFSVHGGNIYCYPCVFRWRLYLGTFCRGQRMSGAVFFFRSFHKNAMTNLTPGSTCLFNVFQSAERVSFACLPFTWRPWSQKGIFRARTSQLSRLQQRLGYSGAKMSGCHDASNFLRAGVTQFSE